MPISGCSSCWHTSSRLSKNNADMSSPGDTRSSFCAINLCRKASALSFSFVGLPSRMVRTTSLQAMLSCLLLAESRCSSVGCFCSRSCSPPSAAPCLERHVPASRRCVGVCCHWFYKVLVYACALLLIRVCSGPAAPARTRPSRWYLYTCRQTEANIISTQARRLAGKCA